MINRLLMILILTPALAWGETYMLLPIDKIYDGDTIKTHLDTRRLPDPINRVSIRIRGIDTPELKRYKCETEYLNAVAAREAVVKLVENKGASVMKVSNPRWGKWGGRIIADVKIGGVDVAQFLLHKGYARSYDGGKKVGWCQ